MHRFALIRMELKNFSFRIHPISEINILSLSLSHTLSVFVSPSHALSLSFQFMRFVHTAPVVKKTCRCRMSCTNLLHPFQLPPQWISLTYSNMLIARSSVTSWLDYFFNIWPFTIMNICSIANKFVKVSLTFGQMFGEGFPK